MARILKICWGPWENASRDKRELSVYRELGHDVLVLAEGSIGDKGRDDSVEGFPVKRISAKPFGAKAHKRVNQLSSLFTWAAYASTLHPDVISGHDWIGWMIGRMSCAFKLKKPMFIYDAHEFELGRNVKRNKLLHATIRKIEKHVINKSAFSIMVNDSIADKVQQIYRLKQRPIVVRSTPDKWEIDETVSNSVKESFLEDFREKGSEVSYILMYHGGLMRGRGIERLIEATAGLEDAGTVILGNGPSDYTAELKALTEEAGDADRVIFHPAVPMSELWKYVGAADISVAPIEIVAENHYYSLPNKFFESIQALTPVIASDVPEMRRIIYQYRIGMTCKPGDADDICRCVKRMIEDKDFYAECKANLKIAKEDLCWENEKKILINAFRMIRL